MTVCEIQGFPQEQYGTAVSHDFISSVTDEVMAEVTAFLGLWIENTEGRKFWMKVFNDLRTRGVNDILIAVTDGLKGMPEALAAVFAATTLQTCIVHLIRNSLDYASWKDRRGLAAAIRPIAILYEDRFVRPSV